MTDTPELFSEKVKVIFLVFVTTKWELLKKEDDNLKPPDNKIQNGIFPEIKDAIEKGIGSLKCVEVELIEVFKPKTDEPYDPHERGGLLRLLQKYHDIKRGDLNPKLWAIIDAAPKNKDLKLSQKQFCLVEKPR